MKGKRLAACGMPEGERACEEGERTVPHAAAVLCISQQREGARGELDADLVRAAGMQQDGDERERLRPCKHAVAQAGLLHAAARSLYNIGLVAARIAIQQVAQLRCVLTGTAGEDGEIRLPKCTGGDLRRERGRCRARLRIDHEAGDRLIQTVDAEDLPAGTARGDKLRHAGALRRDADGLDHDGDVFIFIQYFKFHGFIIQRNSRFFNGQNGHARERPEKRMCVFRRLTGTGRVCYYYTG